MNACANCKWLLNRTCTRLYRNNFIYLNFFLWCVFPVIILKFKILLTDGFEGKWNQGNLNDFLHKDQTIDSVIFLNHSARFLLISVFKGSFICQDFIIVYNHLQYYLYYLTYNAKLHHVFGSCVYQVSGTIAFWVMCTTPWAWDFQFESCMAYNKCIMADEGNRTQPHRHALPWKKVRFLLLVSVNLEVNHAVKQVIKQ